MAGVLEALVVNCAPSLVERVTAANGVVVPLRWTQLGLVPVTDDLVREPAVSQQVPSGFYELTPELATLAASLSADGKVAYVHVEFHGGRGFHAAMGWEHGSPVWGPAFTCNDDEGPPYRHLRAPSQRGEWAVNGVLRWLGVVATDGSDEFREAGLDARKWTEEWLAAASS